ncbi:MAG: dihydrofolate reductase family protein [Friedmanniella sp.]|jgi:dihydrofolate reductase
MRLSVNAFLTVDGVMQGPGGVDEDPSGGFDRGGWLVPYIDEDFGAIVDSWFAKADAILLGRTTYDMMHPYWRSVTDPDNLVATKLNGLPKYVASTTLTTPVWEHTTVISEAVVETVARLKDSGGGELQVHGSCGLARTLQEAGLVDEYRLLVFPVLVGAGKRLFSEAAAPSGLNLIESRVTSTGATYSALAPAPFAVGRVGVEDGHEVGAG